MKRVLVVANETVGGGELLDELERQARGPDRGARRHPALNSPLRHWVSDEDDARAAAAGRLEVSLAAMRAAGMDARGEVGDSDPLQAIDDALRTFAPDEIVISTHPEGRSHWLERNLVEAARERYDLPSPRRRGSRGGAVAARLGVGASSAVDADGAAAVPGSPALSAHRAT